MGWQHEVYEGRLQVTRMKKPVIKLGVSSLGTSLGPGNSALDIAPAWLFTIKQMAVNLVSSWRGFRHSSFCSLTGQRMESSLCHGQTPCAHFFQERSKVFITSFHQVQSTSHLLSSNCNYRKGVNCSVLKVHLGTDLFLFICHGRDMWKHCGLMDLIKNMLMNKEN